MRPLTANLKHLYQYQVMIFFHLTLVMNIPFLFIKMTTVRPPGSGFFTALMMFGLYGQMVGMTLTNTSAKPFSFCLPDHAREAKNMLLLVWLWIVSICILILSILYLFNVYIVPSIFIAYMGLMSLCFWLGVSTSIQKIRFSFASILLLSLSNFVFKDTGMIIKSTIGNHPWIIALICGIPSYLIYHAVGSRHNHRLVCSSPRLGIGANREAWQRFIRQKRMYLTEKNIICKSAELSGIFFSKQIRSNHRSELIPHLWGQVYLNTASIFSHWKLLSASFLGSYFLLFFFPGFVIPLKESGSNMFYVISFILISHISNIFFLYKRVNNFLLTGRSVHFFEGIIVLLTATLLMLGFGGVLILLFNLLPAAFPEIFVIDNTIMIVPIPWKLLVVPSIIVPLFGGLFFLFRDIELKVILNLATAFAIIVSIPIVASMENTPFIFNLMIVLSAGAVTWGFHLAALYYTSMKRSLC